MTLDEALAQRIPRVHAPYWALAFDHLAFDFFGDGTHGPWATLHSTMWPPGQKVPVWELTGNEWEAYTGPVPGDPEWETELAARRTWAAKAP